MARPLKYLFTLALPLAVAGGIATWMLSPEIGRKAPPAYDTVRIEKGQIRKIVSTSGPVRALVTVSVGSQVSGQVNKLFVDFNSEVKPGDVLATIDSRTFDAKVAQAQADLDVAVASLANQQAALAKSISAKRLADLTRDRQVSLQQKGYAATSTLDTAVRDAEVAEADIAVVKSLIESAKAGVSQKEAALLQARIDLERTKIVSPIVGTVISRTIDPGQTVAASLQAPELFKIAEDLRRIRIEAEVNEADVGAVAQGNPAEFTVDAYPDRSFTGKVTQVRLNATELNNVVTYTVIIEASNEDRKLFPGMTANVQINVAEKDGVLRVANDALRFKPRAQDVVDGRDRGEGNRGGERQLAKLKTDLQLSDAQEAAVREQTSKLFAERRSSSGFDAPPADPDMMRKAMQSTIENTLAPLLSAEQRPLFERWKRGRENTKSGSLYVLDASGHPSRRFVRLGLADDQFTEIAGGRIEEGASVVLRSREPRQ